MKINEHKIKVNKLLDMAKQNNIPKQNVFTFIDIALLKMNVITTPIIFWNILDFSLLIGSISVMFFLPAFFFHSKYPQFGILKSQTQNLQSFIFNSFFAGALIGCMLKSVFIKRTLKKLKINSWNDL